MERIETWVMTAPLLTQTDSGNLLTARKENSKRPMNA